MSIKFEKNIIPAIPSKTLGNLEFGAVSKIVEEYDKDNQRTGTILEKHVDLMSDVQQCIVTVVLPARVELENLKFGDRVELEEVSFRIWATIDPKSNSNFAESDVKVTASGIKKIEEKQGLKHEPKREK